MIKIGQRLKAAVLEKDRDKIKELLHNGADPNAVIPGEDFAAIHLGAGTTKSITKLLLKNGADPNLQTNEGSTSLHIAASWGKRDIVKLLLKYGGDETIRDSENLTPTKVAQNHEFWDCANILRKFSKKRLRNKLESERQKCGLHQSVASPAQVRVNVHRERIDVFTECTDRKSYGWSVDNPSGNDSRTRTSPLMSAVFTLPPRADSFYKKESDSVTSSETSTVSSSVKRQMYLKAGSTEHNWENPDTDDFFTADPSLDAGVQERTVKTKNVKQTTRIDSAKSNKENRVIVEDENEAPLQNCKHSVTDLKTGICPDPNNQNQKVDERKNCICIDQCSSAETEENGDCVQHLKYLIGPEGVSKYIVKNDNTDSDGSTINYDTDSTVISTVPNDAYLPDRSEQRLTTEHLKPDKCSCHAQEKTDQTEFLNQEQLDDQPNPGQRLSAGNVQSGKFNCYVLEGKDKKQFLQQEQLNDQTKHRQQLGTENLKSDNCDCFILGGKKDDNAFFHREELDDQVKHGQQPLGEHVLTDKQSDVHSENKTETPCQHLSYDNCFSNKRLQIKIDLRFGPLNSETQEIRDSNSSKESTASRSQNSIVHDSLCRRCSGGATENEPRVTSAKSAVQPDNIHRETINNGTYKLTTDILGSSFVNVQTRSRCDLQCPGEAKSATKQNGKDASVTERTQERIGSNVSQPFNKTDTTKASYHPQVGEGSKRQHLASL